MKSEKKKKSTGKKREREEGVRVFVILSFCFFFPASIHTSNQQCVSMKFSYFISFHSFKALWEGKE
jgi:hypothetical protein